jgi:alcohol dehydrogenase class IV
VVKEGLESGEVELVGVFNEVPPNSEVKIVEKCFAKAEELGADCVISVGGGSSIDTAKATTILMVEAGELLDHQSAVYEPSKPMPPHIAIPTTAGTGSESTFAAVIADHEQKLKLIFQGPDLAPTVAMLDPVMTRSLPPHLTASTGMDAMTHCVEALHSEMHEPLCDGLALHGIKLVNQYIKRAADDGEDIEARTYMLIAANMGGIAFANAFVGVVHAMAHSLGGRFGVPHGVANAILLPWGMEFNMGFVPDEVKYVYRDVAQALGLDIAGMDELAAGQAAADYFRELTSSLGLPQKLREVDVPEDGLEDVTEDAMLDGSMFNNPGEPEPEDILEVFKKAY